MERVPHWKYTKEFRHEAVQLVTQEKLSISEAARRLNLPTNTLDNWLRKYKAGKLGDIGKNYRPLTDTEMELARLKRENAELRMERDILKKQPRTLRRSRCQVRDDATIAAQVLCPCFESNVRCIGKRVLCLVRQAVIETSPG
jgi:transposase